MKFKQNPKYRLITGIIILCLSIAIPLTLYNDGAIQFKFGFGSNPVIFQMWGISGVLISVSFLLLGCYFFLIGLFSVIEKGELQNTKHLKIIKSVNLSAFFIIFLALMVQVLNEKPSFPKVYVYDSDTNKCKYKYGTLSSVANKYLSYFPYDETINFRCTINYGELQINSYAVFTCASNVKDTSFPLTIFTDNLEFCESIINMEGTTRNKIFIHNNAAHRDALPLTSFAVLVAHGLNRYKAKRDAT